MTAVGPTRVTALVALLVLGTGLVVTVFATTPWRPLPARAGATSVVAEPARDFSPAELQRAADYRTVARPPAYAALLVSLAFTVALGVTPLGARLVAWAATPLSGWAGRVVLGGVALALAGRLLMLPFDARVEAVRRGFGLSTRSWGGWVVDVAKGFGISTVLLLVVLLGLFALFRAVPRTWWLPAGAAGALLVVLLSFGYPVVVEPVFNRFTPLPAGTLRTALLDLAAKDGVPVRDVLVADASRRTSTLNAYVSGLGATRRLVLHDTLLERASEPEVRLIVAHELGHAKRRDVLHGTLLGALGLATGSCLLFLLLSWPPLLRRAGVDSLADPRALALVLAVVTVAGTLSGPVQLLVSRRIEARADVHSLDLTRDPATFTAMQHRLSTAALSDPDPSPVVFALFASHPTGPQRIALARQWARARGVAEPPPLQPDAERQP